MGTRISELPEVTLPLDADYVPEVQDGATSRVTWTNIKAFLKTYFDSLYYIRGSSTSAIGISFGGATTGITYTYRISEWEASAGWVNVSGSITLSSKGSATGTARITGLPYASKSVTGALWAAALRLTKVTFTVQYSGVVNIGSTDLFLFETTAAGALTNLTDADFANDSIIDFSCSYPR